MTFFFALDCAFIICGLKLNAIDAMPVSCTNFLLDECIAIMNDYTTKYNLFRTEEQSVDRIKPILNAYN